MVIIILLISSIIILSPYIYRKLTLSYTYCNSYGSVDPILGWELKKNAKSCLIFQNYLNGEIFFDTKIYTNKYGFRSEEETNDDADIAIIGDSWVFGYGANNNETVPYHLSKKINQNIYNLGVPNYSSAQVFLHLKKNLNFIEPELIIYISGMYLRSICKKEDLNSILEPCFWYDANENKAKLALPKENIVIKSYKKNIYPSGALTAGYNFWNYVIFIKTREIFNNFYNFIKFKILKIEIKTKIYTKFEKSKIRLKEIELFKNLKKENNFKFIFIDPYGLYPDEIRHSYKYNKEQNLNDIILIDKDNFYFSKAWWYKNIEVKKDKLINNGSIKNDGHWSGEAMQIISDEVSKELIKLNLI